MAKRRQESRTSDGTVKITRKKRYRPGIEKVSLTGLNECFLFHLITGSRYFFKPHIVVFFETSVVKEACIFR